MNHAKILFIALLSVVAPAASAAPIDDLFNARETYGREVHGLTFKEVNDLLDSYRFYEGRMGQEYFRKNGIKSSYHPFNITTLAKCIENAKATEQEKDALWSKLLYKSSAKSITTYDEHKYLKSAQIDESLDEECRNGLKSLEKTEAEERKSALIFDSTLLSIMSLVVGCSLRFIYLGIFHSHETFILIETRRTRRTGPRAWNDGVRFWNKTWPTLSLAIGALAGYKLATSSELPSTNAAQKTEKLLELHAVILEYLKELSPSFPGHFTQDFEALKTKLAETTYKTENGIDREKLEAYLSAVLEYHDNLVEHSNFAQELVEA